ncbi:succinate-semialdehyde dehydrogenase / glutarate-semialdehyde dehydrogenase [Halopseudomonas sabulinigri]|uniref:Succinate-semialdehyde dehydrogenase / glutarate-semialdehyde dehydrogenase n=1 Tax=Halopseudomonas sabulinigri TaxID=472181 RepID=A0A1H1LBU7_9GAMM|nr:NAD-dependent succinate-semialdehyde dehydrogenase [Halopseudomonas sabulinigri]SDR71963.1 succinate-semialdehyde dehydrogenase / glutarate-semialdehyde dehydrogenase [Halopseudomonas sabulinigri]
MSKTVSTIDPSTGEQITEYRLLSDEAASAAIDRADAAFQSWRMESLANRGKVLNKMADLIEQHSDELAQLMTREMGKPIAQGGQECQLCAAICRYSAEQGPEQLKDETRPLQGGRALITYQPIGVILGIQPWNFPLYQVIRYSACNIMAGNTTVLKHASNVFGMAQKIEQLYLEAGLPEGVFQSLLLDGAGASKLVEHPKVRGVTFTGSDNTGKKIAEAAGKVVKKTVLELGSNDAYVVLSDADIELAVKTCVQGRVVNNGETCVSAKRFVIAADVYDEFRDEFVAQMAAIKTGDPRQKGTQLGPIARKDLRETLHEQVQESVRQGAKVSVGGQIPEGAGFFYPATVLEDVKPGMPAYDGELFGPVAALIKAADDEDAMRIANDSRYGLGGGIFSRNEDRAIELARLHFDTGMVNINGYNLAQPHLPFGGVKDSGYGREHGGFGIREFVNIKAVMISHQ